MTTTVAVLASAALAAHALCLDDETFAAPRTVADVARARAGCRSCPVLALCAEVAAAVHPPGGVWAGRKYGDPHRPKRSR